MNQLGDSSLTLTTPEGSLGERGRKSHHKPICRRGLEARASLEREDRQEEPPEQKASSPRGPRATPCQSALHSICQASAQGKLALEENLPTTSKFSHSWAYPREDVASGGRLLCDQKWGRPLKGTM